jgi:hypothetical protein
MCGRFSQTFSDRDLLEYFHLARSLSPGLPEPVVTHRFCG